MALGDAIEVDVTLSSADGTVIFPTAGPASVEFTSASASTTASSGIEVTITLDGTSEPEGYFLRQRSNIPSGTEISPHTFQQQLNEAFDCSKLHGAGTITISTIDGKCTISGAASAISLPIEDEGGQLTSAVSSINFVGAGVTATNAGSDVTVTIPETDTSSFITDAVSCPIGSGIYSGILGSTLKFRSISGTGTVFVTGVNGNDCTIYISGSGITSASNIGTGSGIYSGTVNEDLKFRSLLGAGTVFITGGIDGDEHIYISGSGGEGTITGASNIGTGSGIYSGTIDKDLKFRSLLGTGTVFITGGIDGDEHIYISGSIGEDGADGEFGGDCQSFTFSDEVSERVPTAPSANGLISVANYSQTNPVKVLFDFKNSHLVDVSGWGDSVAQPGRIRLFEESNSNNFEVYQLDPPATPTYDINDTWPQLETACKNGGTVTITYSFMLAGNTAEGPPTSPAPTSTTTVTLKDHADTLGNAGHVTHAQFTGEISESLNEWKELFEDVFPELTLNLVNLGDEVGTSVASSWNQANYSLPHSDNIGDFRFGMHNIDGASSVLAHAWNPYVELGSPTAALGSVGSLGGDCHFDSSEDWRLDSNLSSDAGALSIKYVTVHELGHVFGIVHDTSTDSVMYPSASSSFVFDTKFPNGLKGSLKEREAIEALYGSGPSNWEYQKRSVTLIDKGGSFSDGDSVILCYVGGGVSAATIPIKDEGSQITSSVSSFDFVGDGVTATNVGAAVTVTIPGGGGGVSWTLPPPINSNSVGTQGQISFDNIYYYICIQENEWRRISIGEW